jgi:hypothetical protein
MFSAINFKEFENQVISATYSNLMIGARIVLVDTDNGLPLPEPVVSITSPAPNGMVRVRLPAAFKPGSYYLRALNGHGAGIAQSAVFSIG